MSPVLFYPPLKTTAQITVILPNLLVCRICGNTHFYKISTPGKKAKFRYSTQCKHLFYAGYLWVPTNFFQKTHYLRISVGFDISGFAKGGWSGPAVVRFVVDDLSIIRPNSIMNFLFEKERNNKRSTWIKILANVSLKVYMAPWRTLICSNVCKRY